MEGYFSNIIDRIAAKPISGLGQQMHPTSTATIAEPSINLDDPFEEIQEETFSSQEKEVTKDQQADYGFSDLLKSISGQAVQKIEAPSPAPLPSEQIQKKEKPHKLSSTKESDQQISNTIEQKDAHNNLTTNAQALEKVKNEFLLNPKDKVQSEKLTTGSLTEKPPFTQEMFDRSKLIQKQEKETIQILEKKVQLQEDRKKQKRQEVSTILPIVNQIKQSSKSLNPQKQNKKLVIGNLNVEVILPSVQKDKNQSRIIRSGQRPVNRFSISGGNLSNKSRFGLGQL